MGTEIDRLEITIESKATKVNNSLDALVSKLEKVSGALSNINSSGLAGLSNGVAKFAQASSQLSNVKTADFTRLSKNIEKLSNFNSQQFYGSSNAMRTLAKSMSSAMVKTRGFGAIMGLFSQKLSWLKQGVDNLWSSVESSMDYIETLNYFGSAFGQVADEAVAQWEEAGYSSADAYYESFSSRAKELTSKMTGFNINADGTLTATSDASLGINPSKLMNYQAMFAQMSSSMGVTSEASLKLSQALTEIGADLASVKNMDFDKVWTDMASGLAGMSRTLDKYGANIRNVNLQQKLTELGIDANITALNQNDKALLRTIILLDSTRYAWGNLAGTIGQSANQMRLLESNLGNLSRAMGNLFLPALTEMLPYLNGFVIALQRLAIWVGNLMGVDLSEITSAAGSSEVDISELLGDTENLTGNLDDASSAAKKLKSNLQGFDELNVIITQEDSGLADITSDLSSGLLDVAFDDILSEYQTVWDEAYANMENRAEEFADKIEKYLQPVKDIIGDFAVGDFFAAGQDTSGLVVSIFNALSEAVEKVDWEGIGRDIGDYLAGINWIEVIKAGIELKINIAEAIAEIWFGSFETAPIESALISGLLLLNYTNIGNTISTKISTALAKTLATKLGMTGTFNSVGTVLATKLGTTVTTSLASLGGFKGLMTTSLSTIFGAGTVAEIGLTIGTGLIGGIVAAIGGFSLGQWLNEAITGEEIDMSWSEQFSAIFKSFTDGSWKGALELWGKDIGGAFSAAGAKLGGWYKDNVQPTLDSAGAAIVNFGKTYITEPFSLWGQDIADWWTYDVTPWFTKEKWIGIGENVKSGISSKWTEFTEWWKGTGLYNWWTEDVVPFFDKEAWSWDGIKEGLGQAFENAIAGVKQIWNNFATWLNGKLNFSWEAVNIMGQEIIPAGTLNLGKIPTFSIGGFPEDGLFMANHHEIVGKFSNGKTAVANNEQIITGIEQGVRDANAEQVALLREQNELLQAILEKEIGISPRDIFDSVKQSAYEYTNRTRKPAF